MPDLTTFRPTGARIVAYGVSVVLVVMTVVIGGALPSDIEFTVAELATLALILLATLALLHGVGRSYVRLTDDGVEVLNGYNRHQVPWSQVKGFAMNPGAPWATLVMHDDERVNLFAVQGSDGPSARAAVEQMRDRLA